MAAFLRDLKQRGMLDDTLVLWGGEFGRTPTSELPHPTERGPGAIIIDPFRRRKPLIWFASPGSCDDRSRLSGLARCGLVRYRARARWSARLDTNCLGSFNDLRGLLDLEMQHTFVEMSFNGSLFRLKR